MYEYENYSRANTPFQPSAMPTNPMINYPGTGSTTYPSMQNPSGLTTQGMQGFSPFVMPSTQNPQVMTADEIERLYPESYNMIYPMIQKSADMMENAPITEAAVNDMANKIYITIEGDNLDVDVKTSSPKEGVIETRQFGGFRPRNRFLNDFIKVLLLRELFDRRHKRPGHRPPHHPHPRPYYNY